MSAADALNKARAAGVRVGIDGGDLVLEASAAPPPAVLDTLSRNKAGIIALLQSWNDGWTAEDWQAFFDERAGIAEFDNAMSRTQAERVAYDRCVVEWLHRNSARSTPGMCDWCGARDRHGAPILPFGVAPAGHTWLHGECWQSWYDERRRQAGTALSVLGIRERGCGS